MVTDPRVAANREQEQEHIAELERLVGQLKKSPWSSHATGIDA